MEPAVDGDEPETRAAAVVHRLGDRYWRRAYGGMDAFECLVRTILSQNTADVASQRAHDALTERYDDPDRDLAGDLAGADHDRLAATVAPAGLQDRKAATIREAASWTSERFGDAAGLDRFVTTADAEVVREALLSIDGVGPKTVDCVLLFDGWRDGIFPVDTHVHRVARRLGLAPPDADHDTVREHLEAEVPDAACGFGHTATIQFGREVCTARAPACLEDPEACPLATLCDRVGVDPEAGTATDPAAADAAGSEAVSATGDEDRDGDGETDDQGDRT